MHIIKLPALIIVAAITAALLIVTTSPHAIGRSLKAPPIDPQSVTAAFINVAGRIFTPDEIVTLKWTLEGDGVKALEQDPWSECELMFSPDGGNTWARISPEMNVTQRTANWIVPKISTRAGMLQLRIGTQGSNDFLFFPSNSFTIVTPWGSLK